MLLFLLFIVLLSKGHSQLNIELKGGEETAECSNDTGRMKFTTEFESSSNEDLISYFLLPLKDGKNQTNYSICMLSLFKDSTQEEPHPSQDEPKYSDESQKPLASGSEIEPSQNPQSTNENENDIGDEEIVLQLEKIRKNNKNGLKNIFGNKEEINETQTYIKYILYYQMITILYENSLTVALGVKATNSMGASSISYTENYGAVENVGGIGCLALLDGIATGRTYYVFAKSKTNNKNNTLRVARLGPGNIN